MDLEDIIEYTDLDLRDQADDEQREILRNHPEMWRSALCILKSKAERQMTSYQTRVFDLYVSVQTGSMTREKYLKELSKEKLWKTGANRFIQEVESKIMELKNDRDS